MVRPLAAAAAAVAAAEEEEEEMSPAIWASLPEELLERIISCLPLRAILSLRPTCRRFNSLLLSPSFLSSLPPSTVITTFPCLRSAAFLLLSHPQIPHRHLPLYDFSSDSWRALSLRRFGRDSPCHSLLLCSSSAGLLCFSVLSSASSSWSSSLLVWNLLTGSFRTLRPPTQHVASATLVSLGAPSPPSVQRYKVLVPSAEGVFVYDSVDQSWGRFDGFDPVVADNSRQEAVFFDGSLYFASPEPLQVVGLDLVAGRWAALAAELPPEEITFLRLASSGDGLFLVGGVGRDGISRSLRVWELVGDGDGDGGRRWREVGRLPEMMCRKFWSVCYHNYAHLYCFWHGGMVCVGCTNWPEVMVYRVGRGTWHWLPRCPMLPAKWSCGFRWFSFVPNLHALA